MPRAPAVKWEWENDDGTGYNDFDKAIAASIEGVYQTASGQGSVKKTFVGRNYLFNFDAMTQVNTDTGSTRRIRRTGPPVDPPTVKWEWLHDHGWRSCDAALTTKLEAAYGEATHEKPTSGFINIAGTNYIFNFAKMEQVNQQSGTHRTIRRMNVTTGKELPSKLVPFAGTKTAAATDASADDDAPPAKAKKAEKTSTPASSGVSASTGSHGHHGSHGTTKLVKKGKGVVDVNSGMQDKAHVYEAGDKVYQCTLNQTNIAQNNNKFYVIQLLESDKGGEYWVWTRWGRVGVVGQSNLDKAFSLPAAIAQFNKKFRDKTSNDFNNLSSFTKVPGKYQLMEMDFGDDDETTAATTGGGSASVPPSALPPQVQELMKIISNKADMEKAMKELEIDTSKMPLGKISKKQIKDAFHYLKLIEAELAKSKPSNSDIVDHSSMFYTLVPHDFGFAHPPPIRDSSILKRKMQLLEVLADLEIAAKILEETKKADCNPLDASYNSLKCKLVPLSHDDPTFKRIQEYAANSHGATHSGYSLVVEEVFAVDREGEVKRYNDYSKSIPNKQLLWHGSRTTNYMGILSQGLRIAPPEAPCTGYMFGKGVYFADSSSKSANYCHASPSNPTGIMVLCEAALGTTKDCHSAMYMDKPKPGTHSTKGVGRNEPKDADAQHVDGVKWPLGKMGPTPGTPTTTLQYNEFIVYDVAQCRMNYLLKVRFKYKK